MSLKEQRREERQKAAESNAAAQKAANVAAANRQKTVAQAQGGRYQEGGVVYQVGAPQGRHYEVHVSETLSFSHDAQASRSSVVSRENSRRATESRRESQSYASEGENKSIKVSEKLNFDEGRPTQKQTDKFNFSSYGELYIPKREKQSEGPDFVYPGLLAKNTPQIDLKGIIKSQEQKSPFSIFTPAREPIQEGFKDLGLKFASLGVAISEDIQPGKTGTGSEKAKQFFERYKSPEYPPFSQQDIIRKGTEIYGFATVSGIGSAGGSGVIGAGQSISRGLKVSRLERKLSEPGIVSGKEKLGPESYLISKGTETKPAKVPFTQVEFGKRGGATATEITPGSKTLSPKEVSFQGKIDPTSQKILGTKQTGEFSYKSEKLTSEGRRTFQKGLFAKEIKPIAEGRTAKVDDILKGRSESIRESIKEPKSVFAQTKAEKFKPLPYEESSKVFKPTKSEVSLSSPKDSIGGAGGTGKAKSFTKQESKTIKTILKAEAKPTKQDQDILFSSPRFMSSFGSGEYMQQGVSIRPTEQKEKTINIFTKPQQIPQPQSTKQPSFAELVPPVEKQTPTTKLIPPIKLAPPIQKQPPSTELIPPFTIPVIIPKQPQKEIPIIRLGTPTRQTTTQISPPIQPPPKPPVEPPIRPKIPFFIPPPLLSRSGGGGAALLGSTKQFYGNVPQDSISGIFGKRQEITYSEGSGLHLSSKIKSSRRRDKPLNIFGNDKPKRRTRSRKTKNNNYNIFGSSKTKSINLFGKSKGKFKL